MLSIPSKGFTPSVKVHRVQLDIMCDWIEGSVLFLDNQLSISDIVDVLVENNIYVDQDFAREMVKNAWAELIKRSRLTGVDCAFSVDGDWIEQKTVWQDFPAHVFCVVLSLATYYDWWHSEFGKDYTEQGDLFELLTQASIASQFIDWEVYHTGWTRTRTDGLKQVVQEVADRLGDELGDFRLWDTAHAKEMGLDILFYKPFPDNRVGIPVYLMQCASGENWTSKLHTPDLNVWSDMIRFRNNPQKAFSVPFSLLDEDFMRSCIFVKGLLLDRCRLLRAAQFRHDWVSGLLGERIVKWVQPKVDVLTRRSM